MRAPVMTIRPFTDTLRRQFGRTAFIRRFTTTAGGAGRTVRFAALFDKHGEVDARRTHAAAGDRWIEVDFNEGREHSMSHFLVTADCVVDDQGPRGMAASTSPTPFTTPAGMLDAIKHELARNDHLPHYRHLLGQIA